MKKVMKSNQSFRLFQDLMLLSLNIKQHMAPEAYSKVEDGAMDTAMAIALPRA
ncbi:hypothetical protein D3C73_1471350 [compost metagenome]